MIYYRVALQSEQSSSWKWRSCTLNSASSVFDVLSMYEDVPNDAIRIFFSSSSTCMDEMLVRANNGLVSNSVTVEEFLEEKRMSPMEIKRLELELHAAGDHDSPYTFALPTNMAEVLAWVKLFIKVHNGELKP